MVSEPVEIDHSQSLLSGLISKTFEKLAADGAQTTPTITTGLSGPNGIAVDAAGKIHVTNSGYDDVTTYNPDGTQTTTTIGIYDTLAFPPRLSPPSSIAVDAAGKIYVVSLSPGQGSGPYWMLTTYAPDNILLSKLRLHVFHAMRAIQQIAQVVEVKFTKAYSRLANRTPYAELGGKADAL